MTNFVDVSTNFNVNQFAQVSIMVLVGDSYNLFISDGWDGQVVALSKQEISGG